MFQDGTYCISFPNTRRILIKYSCNIQHLTTSTNTTMPILHNTRFEHCIMHAYFASKNKTNNTLYKSHQYNTLPFQQFQVLFNSLFKVLFIFRSHYLFAIGLAPIFSFRWNLPPTLSCIPKQLDSQNMCRTFTNKAINGSLTLHAALFQGTFT